MIEFYAQIKLVHIAAALASGGLFAVRGLLFNLGHRWVKATPLRLLSYAVDTTLLTAALMLTTIVGQYPFVDAWLTVKVVLLVLYLVLGSLALLDSRTTAVRMGFWSAGLAVFLLIVSVAWTHDPLGIVALI